MIVFINCVLKMFKIWKIYKLGDILIILIDWVIVDWNLRIVGNSCWI